MLLLDNGEAASQSFQKNGVVFIFAKEQSERLIFFLDIDEVCNSLSYRMSPAADWPVPGSFPGIDQGIFSRLLRDLDPTATGLIMRLVKDYSAGIVIVSTWRKQVPINAFEEMFRLRGFPLPANTVMGCTDDRGEYGIREVQCMDWRNEAGHKGPYLFIDDSVGDYQDETRLVSPSGRIGFSIDDYERAVDIIEDQIKRVF